MGKIMLSQGLALSFGILLLLALSGSYDNTDPLSWTTIKSSLSIPNHVTAAPTVSEIPDQTIYENQTTGPITFTVGDADTPAEALTLTAEVSDPALVPISQITFGGSGMTRTATLTPTENMHGTAVISIGVSDGTSVTYRAFTMTVLQLERIYLPLALGNYRPDPDLIVTQIRATGNNVYVTIKNQGDARVAITNAFWVDVYINPNPVPTCVNQTWDQVSTYGMVWGLKRPALPIAPGGTRTLSIGDEYYTQAFSLPPETLPAGTYIYAQVDSLKKDSDYGAVLEQHERIGSSYNNILGIQLTSLCNLAPAWHPNPMTQAEDDENSIATLPPRLPRD